MLCAALSQTKRILMQAALELTDASFAQWPPGLGN